MNIQTSKGMGLKSSSGMGIKTTKGAALKEGKDIYKSDDYAQMRKYLGTKSHYEGGYNPTPRSRVIKVKAAPVKPESTTPSPEVEVPRIKTPHVSAVGTVKRMLFLFEQNAHSHSPPLGWDAFS